MADVKKLITNALHATKRQNIDVLLQSMEKRGYYKCWSGGHHRWDCGTAQHSYEVYLLMLYLKVHPDYKLKQYEEKLKTISDETIAIVGLLHDLGKMHENYHHNDKSVGILRESKVDVSDIELAAILHHMHPHEYAANKADKPLYPKFAQLVKYEAKPLLELLKRADQMSSGTAWNAVFFCKGKSQKKDKEFASLEARRKWAFNRTIQALEFGVYCDEEMVLHSIYSGFSLQTKFYKDEIHLTMPTSPYDTKITVKCGDFIDVARSMKDGNASLDLCLLICGDGISPVRGVDSGGTGNEKTLQLCSNLPKALCDYDRSKKTEERTYSMRQEISSFYPLDKLHGGYYVKDVSVFRSGEASGLMKTSPWKINVAAVRGKHLRGKWDEGIEAVMSEKVRTLLRIAAINGQTHLVLPAFGADGSWKNPQEEVSNMLGKVLQEKEFKGLFKEICIVVSHEDEYFYKKMFLNS